MMGSKLGLTEVSIKDEKLITDLLDWMHNNSADFTNTFRDLCKKLPAGELYESETFQNWFARWQNRLKKEKQELETSYVLMRSLNPAVIPRNHKVEEALQVGEKGDFEPLHALLHAIDKPYQDDEHLLPYQSPPRPEEKVLQTFCGT
jgi:uncharacterized protein YdiU (UPF0061 family)